MASTSALTASISNLSILNERRNPSFSRCLNPNRNPISLPTLSWSGKTPGRRTFRVYSLFGGKKENNDEAPAKIFGIRGLACVKTNNSVRVPKKFVPFAAYEETTETTEMEEEEEETLTQETSESVDEVPVEDGIVDSEEVSVIMSSLQSYKEALTVGDESKVADIEAFLQSIEDEKEALANKLATLSEELSSARDRTLRISADFDNFWKRTERERLSLVTNAQGEVVETMLPVLDNFERAKSQLKFETEGEEKINNSYQSIYKQFGEILGSLGVVPVETVGTPFDPLLHEAIMREDSEEFEEGIILQEFRKGFKLGERLLRPSMVKVSAGPGPAKSVEESTPSEDVNGTPITIEEEEISSSEGESA